MVKNKKFDGFSLAQLMVLLLIIATTLAASMPIITRKFRAAPRAAAHGKWACMKNENDELIQVGARDASSPLPGLASWKKGCKFPAIPDSVDYLTVQVIGGGAGGQYPLIDVREIGSSKHIDLPSSYAQGSEGKPLEIDFSAWYKITLTGTKSTTHGLLEATKNIAGVTTGYIPFSFIAKIIVPGSYNYATKDYTWEEFPLIKCDNVPYYNQALAGENATIEFVKFLKKGEKLFLKYHSRSDFPAGMGDSSACRDVRWPADLKAISPLDYKARALKNDRIRYLDNWAFNRPDAITGIILALTTELRLIPPNTIGSGSSVAKISGSNNGRWYSNDYESGMPRCSLASCQRYVPTAPEQVEYYNSGECAGVTNPYPSALYAMVHGCIPAIVNGGLKGERYGLKNSGDENAKFKDKSGVTHGYKEYLGLYSPSSPDANKVELLEPLVAFTGGCGGAAGEVVTTLVQMSGTNIESLISKDNIGNGGKAGTKSGEFGQNGGATAFMGIVAAGGNSNSCGDNKTLPRADLDGLKSPGTKGASAYTIKKEDSIGGAAGKFQGANLIDVVNATAGLLFGAGGGGGMARMNRDENGNKYPGRNEDYFIAKPAKGSGGGIIVTW